MRSTIRNYLFRNLRKKKITSCAICSKLNSYTEIEGGESFPPEYSRLIVPNENLVSQFGEEDLMKCSECGSYYTYRTWSPGGSEDAFRTSTYESINPISYLEAKILLDESENGLIKYLRSFKDTTEERSRIHGWGVHNEWEIIKEHAVEIIEDGIEFLKAKPASKMQVYIEESIKAEEEVAKIVEWNLFISKNTPADLLFAAIPLLVDDRVKIREEIASGIDSSILFRFDKQPETLLEIQNKLQKLPEDVQIKKILRTIRFIINPKPLVEFFIPNLPDYSYESLKEHLGKLPGLTIDNSTTQTMYTGANIDFEYEKFDFNASSDDIDYSWSFYVYGECPENILSKIISHCQGPLPV